ncbi:hypothetical protein [Nocardia asteroides]|uniref:hypothetical protein n=1 Tax=Nocardia asteroides TaxID=1824 RepID=UPI0033EA5108
MSSGQRPRTPEHFPRMKWRAALRRQRQHDRAFCLFVTADMFAAWRRAVAAGRIAALPMPVLPPNRPRLILTSLL